jgi:hypothetical protein
MAKLAKFSKLGGITNRYKRHEMPADPRTGTVALWAAENVDIDEALRACRRDGYTLQQALTDADSLWCDGTNIFYRDAGVLYRDGAVVAPVNGRLSYAQHPAGGVIYTDGTELKHVTDSGVLWLAPDAPEAPVLGETTGTLQPAMYIVALTGVDMNGVEGASSAFADITLTTDGGIVFSLPPLPEGAAKFNVYVTGPNGEVLSLHGTAPGSAATYTIADYEVGRELATNDLARMPGGTIARMFNGRLLVADGAALHSSELHNLGLYDPEEGYVLFPAPISIVAPAQNGVFVVADKTYWLEGRDARDATFYERLPYGAVPGSDAQHWSKEIIYWMSQRGLVSAGVDGSVENLQEKALIINTTSPHGATLALPDINRVVTTL